MRCEKCGGPVDNPHTDEINLTPFTLCSGCSYEAQEVIESWCSTDPVKA